MKHILIILFFALITNDCNSQSEKWPPFWQFYDEFLLGRSTDLDPFNTKEIKENKYHKLRIVQLSSEGDYEWSKLYTDTIMIYEFDDNGNAVSVMYPIVNSPGRNQNEEERIVLFKDKLFNDEVVISNRDSIVINYLIENYSGKIDTLNINKSVYNKKGLLEEFERTSSENHIRHGCSVGAFRKVVYKYDELSRPIVREWYQRILDTFGKETKWKKHKYEKIKYNDLGILSEMFNENDSLIDKELILINNVDGITTETNRRWQITYSPLEPKSKLISLITFTEISEFPQVFHVFFLYE
jgi:hypothetical protein